MAPGLHGQIRLDHGSELIAGVFVDWCADNEIELAYFQPDKLQQNGFAERFNGTFRRAFLTPIFLKTCLRSETWPGYG